MLNFDLFRAEVMTKYRKLEGEREMSEDKNEQNQVLHWKLVKALKLVTVEPAVMLFMMGAFLFLPVYEQYYYFRYGVEILRATNFIFPNKPSFCITTELLANYTGSNASYKQDISSSNHLLSYGLIANRLPAAVVTVIFGPIMDRFGRRIGLIFPAIGCALQGMLTFFVVKLELNLYYFIAANLVAGLFGDFPVFLAAAFSYIADVSSTKWRSLRIGIIEAVISTGIGLGQFLGGYWLKKVHCNFVPLVVFFVGCNLLLILYVVLFVHEPGSVKERQERRSKNPKGIKAYVAGFRLYCGSLSLSSTWNLHVATAVMNLSVINMIGGLLISVYYLTAPPFNFNPFQIGVYQSVSSVTKVLSNVFIIGALAALGASDVWIIFLAYLFHGISSVLLGLSSMAWQVFTIAVFQGVGGMVWSGVRGHMSKLLLPEEQGSLFTVTSAIESLASLLTSLVWPLIYPLTLQHNLMSGTSYIFIGVVAIMALPFILSLFVVKGKKKGEEMSTIRTDDGLTGGEVSSDCDSECKEHVPMLTLGESEEPP